MKLDREAFVPKENIEQIVKSKDGNLVVYLFNKDGKVLAKGFSGRRAKPDFWHRFNSEEHRAHFVTNWITERAKRYAEMEAFKAKQKEDRTAGAKKLISELKVGDLFCHSFGYDMTLNDFYQVVEVTGTRKIKVVECGSVWVSGDYGFTGKVSAKKLTVWEPEKVLSATVIGGGAIKVNGDVAYKTTEEEEHYENHMD